MIKIENEKFNIRHMEKKDVLCIVNLHKTFMEDSVLKRLGDEFLILFWEYMIESEKNVNYVVKSKGQIVGFISGSYNSKEVFKSFFLKKRKEIFKGIILKLKETFIGLFLLPSFISYFNITDIDSVNAELLFIVIIPEYRGREISKKLIFSVLYEFRKSLVEKVKVSVLKEKFIVNKLLSNLGFKIEKHFTFCKIKMSLYSFKL